MMMPRATVGLVTRRLGVCLAALVLGVLGPGVAHAGRPTLYLHGSGDGCIAAELVGGAERLLPPGSRVTLVQGAGHFLHLEQPEEVNRHILSWVTG